jgi:hypothetical protein
MRQVVSITLSEATLDQKRAFVTQFLNLDIGDDASEAEIDAKIALAQPGSPIIFAEETDETLAAEQAEAAAIVAAPDDSPQAGPGGMVGTLGRGDPRALIEIPVVDTKDGSGTADVNVGVNGRVWQLKRGFELNVPWRVVVALQNAIGNKVQHVDKGNGVVDEIVTPTRRVGFSFLEKPKAAEIDAWLERSGAEFCA